MSNPVERLFKPGQYLFQEGEHSRSMFLIRKGTIAIRKTKAHNEIELGRLHANEVLGELSFFDRHPRSASAVALTDVEALELSFESLDQIYAKVPDYLKTIMSSVAARLRKANEQIRRLQTEVVEESVSVSSSGFSANEALAAANASPTADEVEVPSDIPLSSLDTSGAGDPDDSGAAD